MDGQAVGDVLDDAMEWISSMMLRIEALLTTEVVLAALVEALLTVLLRSELCSDPFGDVEVRFSL